LFPLANPLSHTSITTHIYTYALLQVAKSVGIDASRVQLETMEQLEIMEKDLLV
jgi:hypothetical protein